MLFSLRNDIHSLEKNVRKSGLLVSGKDHTIKSLLFVYYFPHIIENHFSMKHIYNFTQGL